MDRTLTDRRCFNHPTREAVACCPSCMRDFCRECVVEHEGRVLCMRCLAEVKSGGDATRDRFGLVMPLLHLAIALLVVWAFFLVLGEGMQAIPSQFHEGTLWATDGQDP